MSTIAMTESTLDQYVDKPGIVFLDFWAAWCGPCRTFSPIFEEASTRHPDVVFGKIDTEQEQQLARAFDVRAIPTLMAFRDGVIVFSHSGLVPGDALDDLVAQIKGLDMEEVKRQIDAQDAEAPSDEDFKAE